MINIYGNVNKYRLCSLNVLFNNVTISTLDQCVYVCVCVSFSTVSWCLRRCCGVGELLNLGERKRNDSADRESDSVCSRGLTINLCAHRGLHRESRRGGGGGGGRGGGGGSCV